MSIWQNKNWPQFQWSLETLLPLLLEIRRKQGELTHRGFSAHNHIDQAVTQEQLLQWKAQTSLPVRNYRNFVVPQAPHSDYIQAEMNRFIRWFNLNDKKTDGLLRAGIAHLWFLTIRPFDDGNQRVASVITDLALAQDEKINFKRSSLSSIILNEKRTYDDILLRTQNSSDLEITSWLQWFLNAYLRSLSDCELKVEQNIQAEEYWLRWKDHALNERQRKVLQAMLEFDQEEAFEKEMTNRKYVNLTATSSESAKRDLADLLEKDILARNPGSGRSTSYSLK
jgi:Fic family protein